MKKIKFKAEKTTTVGTVIRHLTAHAKFWEVYKIEGGFAYAKAAGFGPTNAAC